MKITETTLPGVLILAPRVFDDERGFFMETYNQAAFAEVGITEPFVQDNHSQSGSGVLRGLHYQEPRGQGKLVRVILGSIFDVAVDIRRGSPSFGRWFGTTLSAENRAQLWIPAGFAHGFCVTEGIAEVVYKCTELYDPKGDRSILWSDPDIGIDWPLSGPRLSPKDAGAPVLADAPGLPQYL